MLHCLDQRLSVELSIEDLFQWINGMSEQSHIPQYALQGSTLSFPVVGFHKRLLLYCICHWLNKSLCVQFITVSGSKITSIHILYRKNLPDFHVCMCGSYVYCHVCMCGSYV